MWRCRLGPWRHWISRGGSRINPTCSRARWRWFGTRALGARSTFRHTRARGSRCALATIEPSATRTEKNAKSCENSVRERRESHMGSVVRPRPRQTVHSRKPTSRDHWQLLEKLHVSPGNHRDLSVGRLDGAVSVKEVAFSSLDNLSPYPTARRAHRCPSTEATVVSMSDLGSYPKTSRARASSTMQMYWMWSSSGAGNDDILMLHMRRTAAFMSV